MAVKEAKMAVKDRILDGLAWAGVSDAERVARISAELVKETSAAYYDKLTKTRIKEAVRETCPPYGKGKAITKMVEAECKRQRIIHDKRQTAHQRNKDRLVSLSKMYTRLNRAYAWVFKRPHYLPNSNYMDSIDYKKADWKTRVALHEKEAERDKGDRCLALTHWRNAVVCLVRGINENNRTHIATRLPGGEIVRTYLRDCANDLVEAAISLGGPKVRAAFSTGVRVTTDWIGRSTTLHYTNRRELTLPWRTSRYMTKDAPYGYEQVSVLVTGKKEEIDPSMESD